MLHKSVNNNILFNNLYKIKYLYSGKNRNEDVKIIDNQVKIYDSPDLIINVMHIKWIII